MRGRNAAKYTYSCLKVFMSTYCGILYARLSYPISLSAKVCHLVLVTKSNRIVNESFTFKNLVSLSSVRSITSVHSPLVLVTSFSYLNLLTPVPLSSYVTCLL